MARPPSPSSALPPANINSSQQQNQRTKTSQIASPSHPLTKSKERLLEARMGPGGKGQMSGARRPASIQTNGKGGGGASAGNAGGKAQVAVGHRLRQMYASFADPSSHFPGNQQFFFRFIVVADSHRFSRCLAASIAAELRLYRSPTAGTDRNLDQGGSWAGVNGSVGLGLGGGVVSPGEDTDVEGDSQTRRLRDGPLTPESPPTVAVARMRVLGRFFGLLTFWPQWTTLSVGPLLHGGPLTPFVRQASTYCPQP